jgi:hypothetical protein
MSKRDERSDSESDSASKSSDDSEHEDIPAIEIHHLPKIKHNSTLFRDGWISFMLCGKSGCGKTSLMAELIPGISDSIKFICIATMVYRNPFHLAIKSWCEKTHRVCVISDNPEKVRYFITQLHRNGLLVPGEQELLLIFDDFSISNRSGSKYENLVVEAFTRWRNLGVNIVIVCQDASMVATSCRNCTNMRVLFNSASRTAINTFMKDIIERVPNAQVMRNLLKYVTSVPYTYILFRDGPMDVSVGKGTDMKKVMDESAVVVPTYQELMKEIGVNDAQDLMEKSSEMQREIGNTAPELSSSSRTREPEAHGQGEQQSDSDDPSSESSVDT